MRIGEPQALKLPTLSESFSRSWKVQRRESKLKIIPQERSLTIYILAIADEKEVDFLRIDPAELNSVIPVNPKTPPLFVVRFKFFGPQGRMKWVRFEKMCLRVRFSTNRFWMFKVKTPESIGNEYPNHEKLLFQVFERGYLPHSAVP